MAESKPALIQVGQIVRCIRGSGAGLHENQKYQIVIVVRDADCSNGKQQGFIVKIPSCITGHTIQYQENQAYVSPIVWDADRFEWAGEWANGYPNEIANKEHLAEQRASGSVIVEP